MKNNMVLRSQKFGSTKFDLLKNACFIIFNNRRNFKYGYIQCVINLLKFSIIIILL
jgi:hypothetical protein